jgi:rubrerythrin
MKTLKDLMDVAIQQEVDSQKLYNHARKIVESKEGKDFLKELADAEVVHEKLLFNIRDTGMFDLDVEITDPELLEIAEKSHTTKEEDFSEDWTMEQILDLALKREFRAKTMFEGAAKMVKDEEVVNLFKNLADEEDNHHKNIERKYSLLTGTMGEEI